MEELLFTSLSFLLFGLAVGFLSGLLGVGGGIILVPLFTHFLRTAGVEGDVLVKCVLANSMFAIVFTGLSASFNQYKQHTYYLRPVLSTAIAGVISSLVVTYLITLGSWYNKEMFAMVFITLLVLITLRTFLKTGTQTHTTDMNQISLQKFSTVGFGTGIITALSGLGGGIIMVPAFSSVFKIDFKKAISISTGVIPFFALPLTAFYLINQPVSFPEALFHIGHVVPQFIIPLGIGVIISSKWGVLAGLQFSETVLKLCMLALIVLVTIKMLWEAFAH